MLWKNLEYFCYLNYESTISVWEDTKEKLCNEYLSPYFRVKYLSQSQCDTFQVKANRILIPFHVLSTLLNNLSRNYLPRN